jgi:predicted permease
VRWRALGTFLNNIRYALRQLAKAPGFTAAVVLTLALGIGPNAAIFSAVYTLLLQSLPFQSADRIIGVYETHPQVAGGTEATFPDYLDWRAQQKSFEQVAAYSTLSPETMSLVVDGRAEQVHKVLASGNFFSLLGAAPQIGRTFVEQDDAAGSNHVAVLSSEAWQRYFGRDPNVLGRAVDLNGDSYTVVGVLAPGAAYPAEGEVWLPLSLLSKPEQASRVWHTVNVLGRLRPGVSLVEARADMQTVAARLAQSYPATNGTIGVELHPLRDQLVGALRPAMLNLMGAVVLVLLIACANVANLLLVRAMTNRREVAVRQALGASGRRLFGESLAMTLILCLLGGVLGTVFAAVTLPLLRVALSHTTGVDQGLIQSIRLSTPVLMVTLGVCMLTAIVFGLLPLAKRPRDLATALRPGDRSSTNGQSKSLLIGAEIAIAAAVLFTGALLLRSFQRLAAVDPGFRTDHLLSFEMTLPGPRYQDGGPETNRFYEQLLEKVGRAPGVVSVASTTQLPLNSSRSMTRFLIAGAPRPAPGTFPMTQFRSVSPGFFHTMGLGLKQGRIFEQKDIEGNTGFFVVNQAFADHYLAGRDPVETSLLLGVMSPQPTKIPIYGVVANARELGVATETQPVIYLPGFGLHAVLLVRTNIDPQGVISEVRAAVREIDARQPIYHVQTMDEVLSDSVARQRVTTILFDIFALLALMLAGVGMYGVLAYSIAQRTREIGLRIAVGATRGDVVRLVLHQAAWPAVLGLIAGGGVAFAVTRVMGSVLFGTSSVDAASIAITVGGVLLISAAATMLPARRAASVNPMEALRAE